MIKIHQHDGNSSKLERLISIMQVFRHHENSSPWWKFITLIRFISTMNIFYYYEHHYHDVSNFILLWRKFITMMKMHHNDEDSSLKWRFITMMKIIINMLQVFHYHKDSPLWWKIITLIRFITMMKNHQSDKIHHYDEKKSKL